MQLEISNPGRSGGPVGARSSLLLALLFALAACDRGTDTSEDGGDGGSGPACVPVDAGFMDAGSTDIPFRVVPLQIPFGDGGTITEGVRFALQFGIGDAGPIDAFLDTGSAGIQLLESAVSPEVIAALTSMGTEQLTEEFEGGIEATGVVAMAAITLGDRTTLPIPILLIQNLSCNPLFPCEQATGSFADAVFAGYPAIFGVGLRSFPSVPPVGSPIAQLAGNPGFIVKAPPFGGDAGTLRINPLAAEVSAYQIMQLQPAGGSLGGTALTGCVPAWNDIAIPACIDNETGSADYCANALLDTGSPFTLIEWQGLSALALIGPASHVQVTVGPTSAPIGQFNVTVGSIPQPGLDEFVLYPSTLGENLINLGTTVFFRYDVYLNQAHGQVGLLAH